MKTCVSCKYATRVPEQKNVPYCGHDESIVSVDMITGDQHISSCLQMRNDEYKCGEDASLHEPNNSSESTLIIERLKNWFFS